jgi:hypothetical protein
MRRLLSTGLALASLSAPLAAGATSNQTPTPVARRPMTLPDATFRLDDGPYWPLPSGIVETTFVDTGDDTETFTVLNLGFGFGITRDFELGAHLVKLLVDPDSDLADPSVYVLYRFLDGDFELGVFGEVSVPLERDSTVTGGMPLALHLGDSVRLDTGPFIQHDFEREDDPDFIAPFQLPINVSRRVAIGPEAAIILREFERDDFLLGFFAGYTFTSGGGTLGDIGGRFRVPSTEVGLDVFTVMLELDFYFDL